MGPGQAPPHHPKHPPTLGSPPAAAPDGSMDAEPRVSLLGSTIGYVVARITSCGMTPDRPVSAPGSTCNPRRRGRSSHSPHPRSERCSGTGGPGSHRSPRCSWSPRSRVRTHTWDSMGGLQTLLCLPQCLPAAFSPLKARPRGSGSPRPLAGGDACGVVLARAELGRAEIWWLLTEISCRAEEGVPDGTYHIPQWDGSTLAPCTCVVSRAQAGVVGGTRHTGAPILTAVFLAGVTGGAAVRALKACCTQAPVPG